MLTRLHISSFVGFTVLVWLVALWWQGMPVLKIEFIRPFGIVVGVVFFVVTLFNKYLWSWEIFKGWYVKRPDLRGTWKVELRSSWIDPNTNKVKPPIDGYVVIRQSLTYLSLRLMTLESKSILVAHSIELQEHDDLFKLIGVYRNEPNIEHQGVRSEIHHGSFTLDIHGSPAYEMRGHYWTDRETKGGMLLTNRNKKHFDSFEHAESEHGN